MSDLAERVLTVAQAAALLGVGERTYRSAAARGEVPIVRVGRRALVPGAQLARLLEGKGAIDESNGRADDEGSRPRKAFREP